jgi:glucose-1-phosphate thymidylyltransferase
MKGLILAAGKGTRLRPITYVIDKALLPIYDKPTVQHVVQTMEDSGIDEIGFVVNTSNVSAFQKILGHIYPQKKFEYIVKDHDLGMPYSILQAREWVDDDHLMVIPGDNYFSDNFKDAVSGFAGGATAFVRSVDDPSRFGVAVYKSDSLIDIVEKPKQFVSNLAVTAPYIFDSKVFSFIQDQKPSTRGELEITEVLKKYLAEDKLSLAPKDGFWKDIGTFDSLLEASNYLKSKSQVTL